MAIGSDRNLYTCGDNGPGQLGRDTGGNGHDTKFEPVIFDQVRLTGVKFDEVAGTGLTANDDGTWSVTAPAHAAGTIPVSVSWTLNGVAQPDARLSYTYEAAPVAVRTVTFDTAGGSAVSAQQVKDGKKAVRPADPIRDGYRFDGWFDGVDAYDFDQPVTGDLTLTAHWIRETDPQPGNSTQATTTDSTQKPVSPVQKPASPAQSKSGPAGGSDHSGVLSSTGSDIAAVLVAEILALAAGILTLVGVGKAARRS